jgi:Protein of unknown function (DUF1559)
MPRNDDLDEDDRPRRRDADDVAAASSLPPRASSHAGLIIGILTGVFVLCCGGFLGVGFWLFNRGKDAVERANESIDRVNVNAPEPATVDAATAEHSKRNLQRIGSAMENHYHANDFFANNSYDNPAKLKAKASARPLLSWRVHILPYLEEHNLYRQFKLDEPWDSPNNIRLLNQMPAVYGTPEANQRAGPGKTYYRGFSNPGAVFEKPSRAGVPVRHRLPASFPDGPAFTLLVVESGEPVEWTKPEDIDWAPGRPRPSLGGIAPSCPYCHCLMADGAVTRLRKDVPDQTLRLLMTRNDGQVIPDNWRHP